MSKADSRQSSRRWNSPKPLTLGNTKILPAVLLAAVLAVGLLSPVSDSHAAGFPDRAPAKGLKSGALRDNQPVPGGPMGEKEPYLKLPYKESQIRKKADLLAVDPATVPYFITISEGAGQSRGGGEWLSSLKLSVVELVREARKGNAAAFVGVARGRSNKQDQAFWFRQADRMTRPGWGYRNARKTDPAAALGDGFAMTDFGRGNPGEFLFAAALSGEPMTMGGDLLSTLKRENHWDGACRWAREAAMRGSDDAWISWGFCLKKGYAGQKKDPVKAYAAFMIGRKDKHPYSGRDAGWGAGIGFKELREEGLINESMESELNEATDALRQEYKAYQKRMFDEIAARRMARLPEVKKAINQWLDMKLSGECTRDDLQEDRKKDCEDYALLREEDRS